MSQPDDGPLSHHDRTERFQEAVAKLIDYYIEEYDLTLAEFLGVMETEVFNRQMDAWQSSQDDDAPSS